MSKKTEQKSPPKINLAAKLGKAHNLPVITNESMERLAETLKQLGAACSVRGVRSNEYKGGKEPFALKVSVNSFTFFVDIATPGGAANSETNKE